MNKLDAFKKLNITHQEYVKMLSEYIKGARQRGAVDEFEQKKGKLRGYLECLANMQVITPSDMRVLYLYFSTKGE